MAQMVVQMMNEVDGMRQEDYSKDWVMHNGKAEQRSGCGDKQVEQYRESVFYVRERILNLTHLHTRYKNPQKCSR